MPQSRKSEAGEAAQGVGEACEAEMETVLRLRIETVPRHKETVPVPKKTLPCLEAVKMKLVKLKGVPFCASE